jgi:hypothetical protein
MSQNKYIKELFRSSDQFKKQLKKLGSVKHDDSFQKEFKKLLDQTIKDFYILDTKDNRAEVISYMSTLRQGYTDIAPYSLHFGSVNNTKLLKLDEARAVIVIHDKMTRKQFDSIWETIIRSEKEMSTIKNQALEPSKQVFQRTGRTRAFNQIDDALAIYSLKQTGLSIKAIYQQNPLRLELENYNTLYYKIKKLIDKQSLEN